MEVHAVLRADKHTVNTTEPTDVMSTVLSLPS